MNPIRNVADGEEPFERIPEPEEEPGPEEYLREMLRGAVEWTPERARAEQERRELMPFAKRRVILDFDDDSAEDKTEDKDEGDDEPFTRVPARWDED